MSVGARHVLVLVACFAVAPASAYIPAPARGVPLRLRAEPLRAPLRPLRQQQVAERRAPRSAVIASLSSIPERPIFAPRALARTVLACAASVLAFVLGSARIAFAAERTLRRTAPAGFSISGDVLKYAFVGGCMVLGYVFRREETPIIRETPGAVTLDPETLKAPPPVDGATEARVDDAAPEEGLGGVEVLENDSALFGSLQARMRALAEEDASAETAETDGGEEAPPPSDSSESWGTGNTAVLEPPREDEPRGVLDGAPPVEFPPGYPIVDGEVVEVDNTPGASADQVAMLNRMFGQADE